MRRFAPVVLILGILLGCSFSVEMEEESKPEAPKVSLGMDILYLSRGEELPGRLEQIKPDGTCVFTDTGGETRDYPPEQVVRVEFQRKRPGDDKTNVNELDDPILQDALKKEVTPERYPNAAYVTIYDDLNIEVKDDLSHTLTRRYIKKVLTRDGMRITNNSIDYLADRAKATILFARTVTPDGRLLHVDESAIEDGSRFGQYPQYDNARRLKWALKEVNLDSYIDCSYQVRNSPATMLAPLYESEFLRDTEPVIHRQVTVKFPAGVDVVVTGVWTQDVGNISKSEETGPESTTYRWVVTDMPRLEAENMMPPHADVLPHVMISSMDSWQRIGDEYGKEIAKLLPGPGEGPVAQKAGKLIEGKDSQFDRARAVYNFVARDIGYLEIPPSDYSFMPHKPQETLAAGQANALDKAVLLHAMLDSVNIGSTLLLAHRRDEGVLPRENASLLPMSTPVVQVRAEGRTYFCVPTTQFISFGYLPGGVQGSPALCCASASNGLIELPLFDAAEEAALTESIIELSVDGRLHVRRREHPKGAIAARWREWSKYKPDEIRQKFERVVAAVHPGAKLLTHSQNVTDLDKPVVIEYEYEVEGYALTAGGELLAFRVPELVYSASSIRKYERELPMFWKNRYLFENSATIKLPEGFRVKSMPEQVKSYEDTKPFMWYEALFVEKKGTIMFRDSFQRTSVCEPPSGYPTFMQAIKTSAQLAKKWIVVEKYK